MGTRPRGGDEGGADVIALGQGGQALNMDAEESAEGVGLGLAQLRELRSDVLDRAVPLAQLDTDAAVLADRAGAGSVALDLQGLHERSCAITKIVTGGCHAGTHPLLEPADALVGEGTHGIVTGVTTQEAHRLGRELVVVGAEVIVPAVPDDPLAGGTPAAALALVGRTAGHRSVVGELVEMTAHARGREAEVAGDVRSSDRPVLADHREDAVTRTGITAGDVDIRRRQCLC